MSKLDANDIARQHGPETLRAAFDNGRVAAGPKMSNGSARLRFTPCILSPQDPMPSAHELVRQAFTQSGIRTLHHHRGAFYEWSGAHYRLADINTITATVWVFLEQALTQEPRPRRSSGLPKKKPFQPNRARVGDVLAALTAVCNLPSDIEPPAWLTTVNPASMRVEKPEANELLPVRNGLLHLPSGILYPSTPHFFGLNSTDVSFDPQAPEPAEWLRFLRELWPDDEASIGTLQEWFGLCLGVDTRHHKILLLVGPKRAGKGTIERVLQGLLGKDSYASPTLASLGTNFGPAALIGKPLAIIGDARLGTRADQALIAERLLSISGEDAQTIDRKFLPAWTGRLSTRFFVITNELPRLTDASGALASRFIVLTLTRTFYGREDHGLGDRLATELPGILNWAREGFVRLRDRGYFVQPESARDAIDELEALASPVGAFVKERCFVGQGYRVDCDHFFEKWTEWCKETNHREPGTKQNFGRDLRAVVPGIKVSQPRADDGGRYRTYEGIGLR
jgi:putative DNA primase/helicase